MGIQIEDWGRVLLKEALEEQDGYWKKRVRGEIQDTIIFVEHEPVYTAGASAKTEPWRMRRCFTVGISQLSCPVVLTDRGGLTTYQGPGILSAYCIFGMEGLALKQLVAMLENSAKRLCDLYGINTESDPIKRGVYVKRARVKNLLSKCFLGALFERRKIASVGLRISRGVARFGLAVSVDPDPRYLEPLIPCGLEKVVLTSLAQELGKKNFSESEKSAIKTALAAEIIAGI